jgi:hypothetical protein
VSAYGDLPIPTPEGYFTSEVHRRVAEIIVDYDPDLRLAFIPYSQRDASDPNEKPYAVVDIKEGHKPHFVMYADEDELASGALLARLFNNDLAKVDVRAKLKAEEDARAIMRMKEEMEAAEHTADIIRTLRRKSFS